MSASDSFIQSVGGDGETETGPPALTLSQIVSGLLATNYYWGPGQFTYSIPGAGSTWGAYSSGTEPYSGYSTLSASQADRFRAAIALWDQLIAPNFTETNDVTATGNVRVAFTNHDMTNYWGYAYYPGFQAHSSAIASDIWINSDYNTSDFSLGSYDFEALLHELGHTLGLKHTFEDPALPTAYDTTRYSLMSYTFPTDSLHYAFSAIAGGLQATASYIDDITPMVLDIAAIQALYGADPNTAAGNNTYTFSQASDSLQSIYDAGGIDTLDLSNFTRSNDIDLRPGAYSSLGIWTVAQQISYWQALYPGFNGYVANWVNQPDAFTWHDNLGIAFSTVIENAIGGSADDTITGNDVGNVLDGGPGGLDHLNGGAGSDTASYASSTHAVTIDLASQVSWDGVTMDFFNSIENATGSAQNDIIYGDGGNNVLDGGSGGLDALYGGPGSDTVSYASSTHPVSIQLDSQVTWDGVTMDFLNSIENAIGSAQNDIIYGDGGANVLDGGSGGLDAIYGGGGSDTVSYASSNHGVSVQLDSQVSWDGTTMDFLNSIENAIGSPYNDLIFGDGGANVLDGGSGGLDAIYGGGGSDTVSYASSNHGVSVQLDSQVSWDGTTMDFLNSIENAKGSAFDDYLQGSSGDNVFTGGGGNDTIVGGAGNDTIVLSGVLADYIFAQVGANAYTATDKVSGRDGVDTFSGIEFVLFGDGTTHPPTDLIV